MSLFVALLAPREPPQGPIERITRRCLIGSTWDHMIECHRDIRAQRCLDLDRAFGRQRPPSAVHVALKLHAVFVDLAKAFERKHLKAAGVGEQRPFPRHELVEPAELGDHILAGPDVQVVCVGQDDLRADGLEVGGRERAHRRLGADRHEHRRLDGAVGQGQRARARGARLAVDPEIEQELAPFFEPRACARG